MMMKQMGLDMAPEDIRREIEQYWPLMDEDESGYLQPKEG
jgi:hypothetical protein